MGKFSKFSSLLNEKVAASGIPHILFTDNADLRMVIKHLVNMTESDTTEEVASSVEEFATMQADTDSYQNVFANFQIISEAFADKLKSGIETLHEVKSTVDTLIEAYDEKTALRIASDPVLAKVSGINKELTMEDISWEQLDKVDNYQIRSICHAAAGFTDDTNITRNVVDGVINQMPCANQYNTVVLNRIELSQDKFNAIVAALHKAMPDTSREYIAGMFRNLLNLDQNCARVAVNAAREFLSGKTAGKINQIMKLAVDYKTLMSYMTSDVLDLAASTMTELDTHKEVMDAITNVNLYIAQYYRNVVWQNAIMVPGPLCNPDNSEKYLQDGGSKTQLVQHHTKFYKDVKVPTTGISSAFILKSAEQLEKEFSAEALKRNADINHAENEIKRASFIITATNYLNAHLKDLSVQFAQRDNLSKYAESVYDSMPDAPVAAKFYKLIFNAQHISSIVPVLYHRLNDAYSEYARSTGEITKECCEELDIKVYSDMISEYLVDQGVLVI